MNVFHEAHIGVLNLAKKEVADSNRQYNGIQFNTPPFKFQVPQRALQSNKLGEGSSGIAMP